MGRARRAAIDDHAAIARIEDAAGELFREAGMAAIAEDDPPSPEDLSPFLAAEGAWIWEVDGVAVGYLLVERLDDGAHVEQVSVDPRSAGLRIGSRLLDLAADWAAARGLSRLTLTTYTEVPWNAPYYRRLGFVELPEAARGPQLAARIRAEAAHGLHRWPRTAMARPVSGGASRTDPGR